jgi:3-oxoacyl-[acyl-carrier protein] reductase
MNTQTSFQRLENLNGKVVVITGGGGHIGLEIAKTLAARGAKIISLSRSKIEETAIYYKNLPNSELNHRVIEASVTDTESIKKAVADIKSKEGRCDVLINAAASNASTGGFKNITDEIFDNIVNTVLKGTFVCIREFLDLLNSTEESLIVNISSTSSLRPARSNLAYGAAKAGINALTQGLGKSLGPKIRVVGIAPGFLEHPTSGASKRTAEEDDMVRQASCLKRIGKSSDIAVAIESIILDMRFITGQTIVIDGGIIL